MWKWLVGLFKPRQPLRCGGEGLCDIISGGKVCGTIKYRRPTSDEILDYVYQFQQGLGTESQLKEIKGTKDNKAKKCHEILIRDLSVPMAKKIFLGSTGFIDEQGKKLDTLSIDEQFAYIAKFHSFALVDLVAIVYQPQGYLKKKY